MWGTLEWLPGHEIAALMRCGLFLALSPRRIMRGRNPPSARGDSDSGHGWMPTYEVRSGGGYTFPLADRVRVPGAPLTNKPGGIYA